METLRNVGLTILLFLVSWGFYTVGYCDGLESDARARARATVATDPVPAPDWIAESARATDYLRRRRAEEKGD